MRGRGSNGHQGLCKDGCLFSADARETVSDPDFSCSQCISCRHAVCLMYSGETEANRLRLMQGMTAISLLG